MKFQGYKRSGGGCPECVDLLIQFFDNSRKYYGGDKYGAVDIKKAKEVDYIKSSEKKQCYTCKDGICPLPKVINLGKSKNYLSSF